MHTSNEHDDEHRDEHGDGHEHAEALTPLEVARVAGVALAAGVAWIGGDSPLASRLGPVISNAAGVAALVAGGWPILAEALENLRARRMTMELSMTIAIAAAAAIGEFFTALVITLFVLIAEILEGLTVSRGRHAIRTLLDVLPPTVTVRRDGTVATIPATALQVGDAVLVNPGGRIPVDGAVIAGHSFVDQSRITGESLPAEKNAGGRVFAGSINQSGALELRAERIGRDTSFGKIIEAVEQAERSRAPVQRLADQLAAWLVYFALAAAVLTWLLTRDLRATISVIIVAGACGVAAGTPLAILGAIGRAARDGAIVKGGRFLEQLGKVDTVVLDKTGTVTFGEPEVQRLVPVAGVDPLALLDAAAAAESRSEHPLGRTIVAAARARGRDVREPDVFAYTPGRGIDATLDGEMLLAGNRALLDAHGVAIPANFPDAGDARDAGDTVKAVETLSAASIVFVARAGRLLGALAIADRPRPEARAAIAAIHAMGIRTVLLTGDATAVAIAVAQELGIPDVHGDLLPEDKRRAVAELVRAGRTVAMVGDGINDAPALVEAQVGVAMGSGTDVARESADVVLLGNDLGALAGTLALARRTRGIIWANFAGTVGVDAVGIALAAFGLLNPLVAAFIHVSSELTFILNSARLLRAPNVPKV